jgi:hypothetical protein
MNIALQCVHCFGLINGIFVSMKGHAGSRGSSVVSIVSVYGLDDLVIAVQSLAEAKDFSSSLCVQTGSGAHPVSYPVGIRGLFPRG